MQALDTRIIELANTGTKAKAITEALRHEGTKTPRGKVPSYSYIQNRLQALKANGTLKKSTINKANSSKAQYTPATQGVNMAYQNVASFVLNVANNTEWNDAKKVSVLKAWFS